MWTGLTKLVKTPVHILNFLARIVSLLEENNQLQRELHLKLTGTPAATLKRTASDLPLKRRTGSDVTRRNVLEPSIDAQRTVLPDDASAAPTSLASSGDPASAPEGQSTTTPETARSSGPEKRPA